MAEIVAERVPKTFGGGVTAVDDISLRIEDGEIMPLVSLPAAASRRSSG